MQNYQGASLEEQVKILLEQNLAYSKEIYHMSKKIKGYILWGRIMTTVSLVVFVILPIIVGVIIIPPLIKDVMGSIVPGGASQTDGATTSTLINQIKEGGGALNYYQQILDQYNQ